MSPQGQLQATELQRPAHELPQQHRALGPLLGPLWHVATGCCNQSSGACIADTRAGFARPRSDLSINNFSGTLPPEWGGLLSLTKMWVS